MITQSESFAKHMRRMAYFREINIARQIGYSNPEALASALDVADDTFDLVMAPMPDITTGRFRP